jgi:hypothetical protein
VYLVRQLLDMVMYKGLGILPLVYRSYCNRLHTGKNSHSAVAVKMYI